MAELQPCRDGRRVDAVARFKTGRITPCCPKYGLNKYRIMGPINSDLANRLVKPPNSESRQWVRQWRPACVLNARWQAPLCERIVFN